MSGRAFPKIRPTKHLVALFFLLVAMWYAAASQGNGAAYVLLFLLLGVFLVSLPHTLLNLTSLKVTVESVKPVFAGQEVAVPVAIVNPSRSARHAICVCLPHAEFPEESVDEIRPGKACRVLLRVSATQRGEHTFSSVQLASSYPLGFLKVCKCIATSQRYLVYPKPAGDLKPPSQSAAAQRAHAEIFQSEGDEFSGVRAYVPGESQRHVDWKAVARGQPMMTKQFVRESTGELHLDFATIPFSDTEQRLSQLALWVVEAERARHPYSLQIPALKILPSLGEAHYHRCLRALALFQS